VSYLERIIADRSVDEPAWLAARIGTVGASDAASFSKPESVPLYVRALLKSGNWSGNRYTESGNTWEGRMLRALGIPENAAMIRSTDEPGFTATPDGIEVLPTGEIVLTECKAIHNRIITGPTLAQRRQMWWAQFVVGPEVRRTKFVWQHLDDDGPTHLEPHVLVIERDDDAIARLLTIARPVLDQYRAALQFGREIAA
jgi:hypothetical protein